MKSPDIPGRLKAAGVTIGGQPLSKSWMVAVDSWNQPITVPAGTAVSSGIFPVFSVSPTSEGTAPSSVDSAGVIFRPRLRPVC